MAPLPEADKRTTLAFARGLALEASAVLASGLGESAQVRTKGSGVDLVTDVDLASERLILERLAQAFPDDCVLAEESGGQEQSGGRRWLVDPLDGTTNFAHGFPFYCVSLALEVDGRLEVAVVRAPALGWEFAAARGMGAALNGRPIAVSSTVALERALLATGFPYDRRTSAENNFDNFAAMQRRAGAVRRLGSAALDLCLVAAGQLDGYWELKLKPWDLAAGVLLVEEAGGRVSALDGGPLDLASGHIVASNGRIHDEIVGVLAETAARRR